VSQFPVFAQKYFPIIEVVLMASVDSAGLGLHPSKKKLLVEQRKDPEKETEDVASPGLG
jgi:hypothetical protein